MVMSSYEGITVLGGPPKPTKPGHFLHIHDALAEEQLAMNILVTFSAFDRHDDAKWKVSWPLTMFHTHTPFANLSSM